MFNFLDFKNIIFQKEQLIGARGRWWGCEGLVVRERKCEGDKGKMVRERDNEWAEGKV